MESFIKVIFELFMKIYPPSPLPLHIKVCSPCQTLIPDLVFVNIKLVFLKSIYAIFHPGNFSNFQISIFSDQFFLFRKITEFELWVNANFQASKLADKRVSYIYHILITDTVIIDQLHVCFQN